MALFALLYGLFCYLAFLGTFGYLVAFVGDLDVPRTVASGHAAAPGLALAVDLALLALFGCQHSLMARPWFKRACTRVLPPVLERSTYVLCANAALVLLFACWRPLPALIWQVQQPILRLTLWAGFAAGVLLVLASTFMINHFELFGLRQVWYGFRGLPCPSQDFRLRGLYARVRHPLMAGFLVLFWATPDMTLGQLVFALGMTTYILVGTVLEERDLIRTLGTRYQAYRREVPRFFPSPWRRAKPK